MHRSARTLTAGVACCAALLAACGGGAAPSDAADPATASPPTVAQPTAPPPTGPAPSASAPASSLATQASGVPETPAALRFTAPLVGGGEIDLAGYAGQPVLFWFWAPY